MSLQAIDALAAIGSEGVTDALAPRIRAGAGRILSRIAREPLIHFLILGTVLYWAGLLLKKPMAAPRRVRIEVRAAEIRRLSEVWEAQWRRPPRPAELQSLMDDYIREEVLFREALAMGLDRDDTIVRRRLIQKMEFLEQGMNSGVKPEAAIQEAGPD